MNILSLRRKGPPEKEKVTVYMTPVMKDHLVSLAKSQRRSLTSQIVYLLTQDLNEMGFDLEEGEGG